jgi:hypothetical protein
MSITVSVGEEPVNQLCSKTNHNASFKEKFCHHLGVLIFAPLLSKVAEKGLQFINQWLVSVLLGCQNIEQGKELNYASLEMLIGKSYKTLRLQRHTLKEVSSKENTLRVMQLNAELVGVKRHRDFYYDPHSKHYTGHLKTLATWCPSVRLADKGLNMDYIHTTTGHPVYFSTDDNFYDLRERFFSNIDQFRSSFNFDQQAVLTWIIDRGIYSIDVFQKIIDCPDAHIITWEKGYEEGKWNEKAPTANGSIVKKRNNKDDKKLFHYACQELEWEKQPSMRQIIVRIFDKDMKKKIEVSIITDDKERPIREVVELMLSRWVQENDFKYLIKHFGLNQLTSYAFTDYLALKDKIEDKIYTCQAHKALTKDIRKVRNKLKTALLRKHAIMEKLKGSKRKDLPAKEKERRDSIMKEVEKLNAKLEELKKERSCTIKNVSKIEEMIAQDYKKLDTNAKDFMDAIKILARNMFYLSFQPFKEAYNNYRDDHVLFRHLTKSSGKIIQSPNNYKVQLIPQMEYQPKVKKIITSILDQINELRPELPDGTRRKIELSLDV